nr:928_t:CDS:2 [Entrophospora candida]
MRPYLTDITDKYNARSSDFENREQSSRSESWYFESYCKYAYPKLTFRINIPIKSQVSKPDSKNLPEQSIPQSLKDLDNEASDVDVITLMTKIRERIIGTQVKPIKNP